MRDSSTSPLVMLWRGKGISGSQTAEKGHYLLVKRSLCPSDRTWVPEQSPARRTACHRQHSESQAAEPLKPVGAAAGVTWGLGSGPGNETGGSKAPPSALGSGSGWAEVLGRTKLQDSQNQEAAGIGTQQGAHYFTSGGRFGLEEVRSLSGNSLSPLCFL